MVTPGWVFWWCLWRTARERRFRLPHCPLEILLGQWGVGTCLPKLENILYQLAASVRGLFPDLQFVIATCQWNQTSECVLAAHKCCKHHYMVLFVSLVEFFLPSAENLVQNLPPLLSRNVVIFSWVYLRPGYARDQVNSMAEQEKAISRIYGQALNYHIESKWSQGYKYKKQICSGIAMSLLPLDTPRAFSATRPGDQELLETPYLPNFSPISIYPCIPGAVLASGAGELFLSNNPFLGIPSASAVFPIQQLSPLGHKGFDVCCTNDVCLRNQIWSSERDPFIFSHSVCRSCAM